MTATPSIHAPYGAIHVFFRKQFTKAMLSIHCLGGSMKFYLYLLLGFLGGIPAGMGMGGGTVTIPLLTLVGGVPQKIAQSANLFAFLPMSAPALKIHAANGLLKTQGLLWIILPAFLLGAVGAVFAAALPSKLLRKLFGVFLIGLAGQTLRANKAK
jgi:uncharacterized membrane protein YfcA